VRIQGVDNELQELADFGLEFSFRHTVIIEKPVGNVRPAADCRLAKEKAGSRALSFKLFSYERASAQEYVL
jgi:hypothetical protein